MEYKKLPANCVIRVCCIDNSVKIEKLTGLNYGRREKRAHQTSDFLVIRRTFYKQTFIKTGRKGNFIENAPLSSRFYEYLYRDCCDYQMGNLTIG